MNCCIRDLRAYVILQMVHMHKLLYMYVYLTYTSMCICILFPCVCIVYGFRCVYANMGIWAFACIAFTNTSVDRCSPMYPVGVAPEYTRIIASFPLRAPCSENRVNPTGQFQCASRRDIWSMLSLIEEYSHVAIALFSSNVIPFVLVSWYLCPLTQYRNTEILKSTRHSREIYSNQKERNKQFL